MYTHPDKRPWVVDTVWKRLYGCCIAFGMQMLKLRRGTTQNSLYCLLPTLVENPLIKIYLDSNASNYLREAAKRDHLPLSVNKVTPDRTFFLDQCNWQRLSDTASKRYIPLRICMTV